MNKIIITLFLLCFTTFVTAQVLSPQKQKLKTSERVGVQNDSLREGSTKNTSNKGIKNKDVKITEYLIVSNLRDTTYVDTTQSITKEYKYNYLRKDNFELMPFSNLGQTYNTLSYDAQDKSLMPKFGARARHFNYMEIEDINYFHVPTPLTELFYKSAFEQGQLLDALFTTNISKQINLSVAYKGLRSLGKYQHLLTSTGNFRSTISYKTKNRRYIANAHFVSQDLLNQENGGLKDDNVAFFISGEQEFRDRGALEVNFEDAESILRGKRFYLNHSYDITVKNDSLQKNHLDVTHVMTLEDKSFVFEQAIENEFFGDAYKTRSLVDWVKLEEFSNQLQLNYENSILGQLQFNATHTNYNYGYNKLVILNGNTITNRLKGDIAAIGGKYKKQLGGFLLQGDAGTNLSGDFAGNYITVNASYKLNDDILLSAQINNNSKAPNYNAQLYQSDYINYNWQNQFKNIKTQQLSFNIKSKKLANIVVDLSTINDHVYFTKDEENNNLVKPFQSNKSITYLRVKANKEISYSNFHLNNTIMYQNVQDENQVFNVPQFITRNTLYYANNVFKKAMYLETGVTFNFFTKYNMNGYDPLLAEFYVQNEQELGGYPRLDFFVNAKIRQTRIFLKAEHFNSAWTGYDYFSAPNNPYRDFTVRFGVVWNFFL